MDAETEDGKKEGEQGALSSHHGHRLRTFLTAGEQMKWRGGGERWRAEESAGGGVAAAPPAKSLLTLNSLVYQPLL